MFAALRASTPLTVAAIALLAFALLLTVQGASAGPTRETSPPRPCPPGWTQAASPLNPELGCVNTTIGAAQGSAEHPGHCPLGWVQAVEPLNDALTCVNNTLTANPTPTPTPLTTFKANQQQ